MKLIPFTIQRPNGKSINATVVSPSQSGVVKLPSASGVVAPLPVTTSVVTTSVVAVKQEPMDVEEYSQAKGKNDVSETTLGSLKSILDKRSVGLSSTPMPVLLNTFSGSQARLAFNGHGPQVTVTTSTPVIGPPSSAFTALPNLPIFNPLHRPALIDPNFPPVNITPLPSVSPVSHPPPKLTAAPSPKSSPNSNGVEVSQSSKNGQLLTLPSAVAKRLNLKQPLALKINNMQITVPPSCLLLTADGLKVFLPPKTFPVQLGETAKLCVTVTNDKSSPSNSKISVNIGISPKPDTPGSKNGRASRQWKSAINPGSCHIKRLYGGFDCMLCIFQYLNMHDLAR